MLMTCVPSIAGVAVNVTEVPPMAMLGADGENVTLPTVPDGVMVTTAVAG
jgi:hypothetical protein